MITLNINGEDRQVFAEPDELLVWEIHEKVGLTKTRFGCGIETCGAFRVLVDGKITSSCVIEISQVIGKKITTKEAVPADQHLITGAKAEQG